MTTVKEEIEQSTEDIVNAMESSNARESGTKNQTKLGCRPDKILSLPDSQNNPPVNQSTSNAKERLECDKDTIGVQQFSKDCSNSNNDLKLNSKVKTHTKGETQESVRSTISSNSIASLQPLRYSSVQTSNVHIQNPSSSSPTVQAIMTTQVAAGITVATIHENNQVCVLLIVYIIFQMA